MSPRRFNLYLVTFRPSPGARHRSQLANQPDGSQVAVLPGFARDGRVRVFGVGEFTGGRGAYPVAKRHTCELIGTTPEDSFIP